MVRLNPVKAVTVPWLVTVTGIGCAACPAPVVPNCTRACGEVAIPAGSAPVPLNAVVAGAAPERIELAVSDPVIVPLEVGANSTPAVQLPPPARAAVQVVFVRSTPNPCVAVNSRSVIPDCPEFFTVTSWVPLTCPIGVAANVNCTGAVFNAAAVNPVPVKLAVAVIGVFDTLFVVLETIRNPCRPPATVGLKFTATEQLLPAASVWVQFDELSAKSPAAVPEIA
jgi:hypothetical protein